PSRATRPALRAGVRARGRDVVRAARAVGEGAVATRGLDQQKRPRDEETKNFDIFSPWSLGPFCWWSAPCLATERLSPAARADVGQVIRVKSVRHRRVVQEEL